MKNNINMKILILWLLGIAAGCFAIAAIFAIITGSGFIFDFNINNEDELNEEISKNFKGKYKIVDEEKTFDLEKIKEIYIDTISTDINIINEDRDDMRVYFHGKATSNVPKLDTKIKNERLSVKLVNNTKIINNIGINFCDLKLDIYVPKKVKQNISIETTSGDITIEEVKGNLKVDTTSGDLKVDSVAGENINLESTSGDIFVKYKKLGKNTNIESSSGDVRIYFPKNAEFKLKTETSSGDIIWKFPIIVKGTMKDDFLEGNVGNSENTVIIKTSSGDVELYK